MLGSQAPRQHCRPTRPHAAGSRFDLNEDARAVLWAHVEVHRWYWAGHRPSRWKWVSPSPQASTLVLVASLVLLGACRAILPDFAPGWGDIPQGVRDRAALLFVLCWVPALRYLAQRPAGRRPIPFLAIYGGLYSAYYAVSPMLGIANLLSVGGWAGVHAIDATVAYGAPVDLLLRGWIVLCVGYWGAGRAGATQPLRIDNHLGRLRAVDIRNFAFGLLGIGIGIQFLERTTGVPLAWGGLGALLKLVSQAAIVVLIVLSRRGELSKWLRIAATVGIAAAVFMELGGSATGGVMFVLFAVFAGLWIGRTTVSPALLIGAAFALAGCVAIRGVMGEWRTAVWVVDEGKTPPLKRSEMMIDLLEKQVSDYGAAGAVSQGWQVIARRSANTDMLVDVGRRTPGLIPYWGGVTYNSLVGAFVPRFIWPEKPQKTLGQDFGHRYGYIGDRDTDTSINLPILIEFYINYGTLGVVLGMGCVGAVLRIIENVINRPRQGFLVTAAAVPLLARLQVMECDLSLMFGGLPLQLFALVIIALVLLWIGGVIPHRQKLRPPWYAIQHPRRASLKGSQSRRAGV